MELSLQAALSPNPSGEVGSSAFRLHRLCAG